MISGLIIHPRLEAGVGPQEVFFTLDPYDVAQGPIRSIQKFAVVLMTTKGTDAIRPWFGTLMPRLSLMTIANTSETKVFIRDQVEDAIEQFFTLQTDEYTQNASEADDVIQSIELVDISITETNNISVSIKFTSQRYSSIIYSLKIKE